MPRFDRRIRPAIQAELDAACLAEQQGHAAQAFEHLERAHVLGQMSTVLHVRVHWAMLRWALRQRRTGEAAGQWLRIVGAATKTALGWVPHGNTGGTSVSALRRMRIPPELQRQIDAARE
jgi:hypothetical protein